MANNYAGDKVQDFGGERVLGKEEWRELPVTGWPSQTQNKGELKEKPLGRV